MSFGRNPHVVKADAAELKAQGASDDTAYEQAWREAARLWDRAADRESDAKRRALYSERAESARTAADTPRAQEESRESDLTEPANVETSQRIGKGRTDPSLLN